MRDYEIVIESEQVAFQKKLASDLVLATCLAMILGAFIGFCGLIDVVSFIQEVVMGLPRMEFPWGLGGFGAIVGAIVGIVLVRRT